VTHPRLIVKCNGTGILELRVARTIWPDVPFVILVREPVEVMVSLLHRGSDWLRFFGKGLAACRTFGWKPEEIRHSSIEEYIARGIGRFCEEVVALQDPRSLIVDYSALRYDGIPRIARFFGLKMPAGDSDELLRVMATYSKDKKRELAFEDDRDAKHGKASGAVRESAERWAQEPYRRLMQMDVLRERRVAFSVCGPCRTGG
jgi:hypothetical protein